MFSNTHRKTSLKRPYIVRGCTKAYSRKTVVNYYLQICKSVYNVIITEKLFLNKKSETNYIG